MAPIAPKIALERLLAQPLELVALLLEERARLHMSSLTT